MKYGNKSLWKKISHSRVVFAVLILIAIIMARATWNMYDKASYSKERLDQSVASLAELTAHQKALNEKVEYLSTDQGIQSEIRTKFRAVEEGESVAVIVGDISSNNNLQSSSTVISLPWWRKIFEAIGF